MVFGAGTRQWVRGTLAKIGASSAVLGSGELLIDEAGGVYGGDGTTALSLLKRLSRIDEVVSPAAAAVAFAPNAARYPRYGGNFWNGDPSGAKTAAQQASYLANSNRYGPRRMLLVFHIAYDNAGVLRIVQDGFNSTQHSPASYAASLAAFTAAGYTPYAIKVHQSGLSTTSVVASSQFWTDYTNLISTLAARYKGVCPWFFITNEFDLATTGTTYSTQINNLITAVQGQGFKAAMSFANVAQAAHSGYLDALDGIGLNTYPAVGNQGTATTPAAALAAFERNGAGQYLAYRKQVAPTKSCFISETGTLDKLTALETPSGYSYPGQGDNAGAIQSIYWQAQLTYAAKYAAAIDGVFGWDQDGFSPYTYDASLATMKRYSGAAL